MYTKRKAEGRRMFLEANEGEGLKQTLDKRGHEARCLRLVFGTEAETIVCKRLRRRTLLNYHYTLLSLGTVCSYLMAKVLVYTFAQL
jgi:hypothetical protein